MKKILLTTIALILASLAYTQADKELVGNSAPNFKLENVDNQMISLMDYSDAEGIILVFTCNHCPYAKMYEDRIIELDKKYRNNGFPVVAINPNDPSQYPEDSFKNMKKRAKEKGFTFPYLFDKTQETATAYGAIRTPHVYLLKNEQDDFQVVYAGAIDDNPKKAEDVETKFLEDAIEAVKSNSKVDPEHTKAIGCSIKWTK